MNIDRILSLVMAVTLIIVLCFLYIIFQDLGDLWTEAEYIWETFDDFFRLIKSQTFGISI